MLNWVKRQKCVNVFFSDSLPWTVKVIKRQFRGYLLKNNFILANNTENSIDWKLPKFYTELYVPNNDVNW